MKCKLILFFSLFSLFLNLSAQDSNDPEYWRAKGYHARIEGKSDSSLIYYNKVLEINPDDWDATLATARLYYAAWKLPEALQRYKAMFEMDSTDIHALNGLGLTHLRLGQYDKALKYLNLTLYHSPNFVSALMGKAKIVGDNGKMKEAIELYDMVIAVDSTIAEAIAGKATMLFWSNRPKSALPLFERALELDPTNKVYEQSINRMKRILAYNIGISYQNILEEEFWLEEDVYSIRANVEHLFVSKRLNDFFGLGAGVVVDFSDKVALAGDTSRRFDNYYVSAQFIKRDHSLDARFGYSITDDVPTNYGLTWNSAYRVGKLRISNRLSYNYDYFYYWNQVSRDYINEYIRLNYKKWSLESSLLKGVVRPAILLIEGEYFTDSNPFTIIRSGISYKIIEKPNISIALVHEWRNFDNRSIKYWSPSERSLISPGLRISHEWKNWYAYGVVNVGQATYLNQDKEDERNIDGSADVGYTWGKWTFGLGYSGYSNPYYQNSTFSVVLKTRL